MSRNAPIIVKRKKVVAADGHHGGAWKVAYADFVTAMMAFFMLMWLLNATTEQQRKGIADYFSPEIPINRVSGGGDGAFGGDSLFEEERLARSGERAPIARGGPRMPVGREEGAGVTPQPPAPVQALREVEDTLLGRGGESLLSERALRHVVTRLTEDGLIVEIFDVQGAPLFEGDSARARPVAEELARVLARVFRLVENPVAVTGHVRTHPVILRRSPVWALSADRATAFRRMMEDAGLDGGRMHRVTGHADRDPATARPGEIRNNRIEVVLLRSDRDS